MRFTTMQVCLAGLVVVLCSCSTNVRHEYVIKPTRTAPYIDPSFDEAMASEIDAHMVIHADNHRFSGRVFVAKGDTVLFTYIYGRARHDSHDTTLLSDLYLIGSVTKPFTALAIRMLAEDGDLSLEDPVAKWYPDLPGSADMTIQDMLDHRSGVPDYYDLADWKQFEYGTPPDTVIAHVARLEPWFAPGTNFRYSNTGYIILGRIIERVAGRPFHDFIQEEICEHYGLLHTGVATDSAVPQDILRAYKTTMGYETEKGLLASNTTTTDRVEYADDQPFSVAFSSGNMYSTVEDLQWFMWFMARRGELLPQPYHDATEWIESRRPYKNGWAMRTWDTVHGVGHYGEMNGFTCAVTYLPEHNYYICLTSNEASTRYRYITSEIVKILTGGESKMPLLEYHVPVEMRLLQEMGGTYSTPEGKVFEVYASGGQFMLHEAGATPLAMYHVGDDRFTFRRLERYVQFDDIQLGQPQSLRLLRLDGTEILRAERHD